MAMTIQFTLPDEYEAAAKLLISQQNPANTNPTTNDVLNFLTLQITNIVTGLFPSVYLNSQASNVAQLAALQSTIKAAGLTAMNINLISST